MGRALDPRVGLCSLCARTQVVRSGRGSAFWLCGLAKSDPRFRKYPPLPVMRCEGFRPEEARPQHSG